MKLFNHKLRTFMVAGIALFAPLPFSSVALALDQASPIENVPPEVLAISLRHLLEQGNYQSFLKAELVNKSNFQAAINGDPVLKGTLQGLRDPKLHKLIDGIKNLKGDLLEQAEKFFPRINSIAQQVSDDPAVRTQISRNLIRLIFKPLNHIVEGKERIFDIAFVLTEVAQHLPIEDLPLLDDLVAHAISKQENTDFRYLLEGSLYLGLAANKNITPGLTIVRIQHLLPTITKLPYPYIDPIHKAILEIAKRQDIDEKTIQFFKENESSVRWQRDKVLKRALDAIKANPAYSK